MEGYNGRLDALQAAVLRIKLKHLSAWNEARRRNADLYRIYLKNVEELKLPVVSDWCTPVYHLYVIQLNHRDQIIDSLNTKGIETGIHYPVPLHLQRAYAHLNRSKGSFPVAEYTADRILSLPMYPELTEEQIKRIADTLKQLIYRLKTTNTGRYPSISEKHNKAVDLSCVSVG